MYFTRMNKKTNVPEVVPKGLNMVLQERKLWQTQRSSSCSALAMHAGESCCARTLIDSQPDFMEEKSILEHVVSVVRRSEVSWDAQ